MLAGPAAPAPVVFEDPADDIGGPDLTRIAVGNTAQAFVLDLRIPNRAAGPDVSTRSRSTPTSTGTQKPATRSITAPTA